jgi:mono/diheme cytochrome c family protein
MTRTSKLLLVVLLAATIASMSAQPPQGAPAPSTAPRRGGGIGLISRPVPDAAAVERGQKVFVAQCGFCHGTNANGGETGPDLIRSVLALDDENGEHIGPVIQKGRPDKGMPAFPMTDAQVADISAFLRAKQQAAINRGRYTILNVVTGDAQKGEAYFNGAGGCNKCHSPSGDLAGIGAKYDPVTLQSRLLFPGPGRGSGRRGPPQRPASPATVKVTLPSGQAFSGTLQYMDDFNVALRDSSGDYRSFSRDPGVRVDLQDPLAAHEELLKKYTDAGMHNILAYLVTLK